EVLAYGAAVARERERHVGARERGAQQDVTDMRAFGGRGLEELPPSGDVEEELADLDHRPRRSAGRADHRSASARDLDLASLVRTARSCSKQKPGHGGDAGQGLAAKAERA